MIRLFNKTMSVAEIQPLVDRYMSGDTTNEEETQLRSWFRSMGNRVPEDWRPLRAMLCFVDIERNRRARLSLAHIMRKPRIWASTAVAAAVVALALLVPSASFEPSAPDNIDTKLQSYAVIDGKVYTSPEVIKRNVDDALRTVACEYDDPFSALDMMQ